MSLAGSPFGISKATFEAVSPSNKALQTDGACALPLNAIPFDGSEAWPAVVVKHWRRHSSSTRRRKVGGRICAQRLPEIGRICAVVPSAAEHFPSTSPTSTITRLSSKSPTLNAGRREAIPKNSGRRCCSNVEVALTAASASGLGVGDHAFEEWRSAWTIFGRAVRSGSTPSNPLQQAIPPQGHWCNIERPTRRRRPR